ncbi:hypothetical protein T459_11406 [Capsicum annuum]|uniref:RNase H type-1 domain-containing protein n=1 Tax=Capsicum annuum TaxID=4072 RepID=A0A2G2ZLX3_CAPAN|nr:hypothetical protein T459_11406 [Capsicum annuum]
MGHAKYQSVSTVVKWNYPGPGYVKLNCDGCSKDNTGPCGGRGIIGDDKGHFVNLYNVTTRYKTNNMAETVALSIGIEWCIQQGSRKLKLNVTPN